MRGMGEMRRMGEIEEMQEMRQKIYRGLTQNLYM
jgi:hypothetical protein